jgi:hypothetical protein
VDQHRLGDDEAADEQEDGRVGHAAEDVVGAGHVQDHAQAQPDDPGDRDRDGLGDPPDNHQAQDRRQGLLLALQVEGEGQQDQEHQRPEEQPDGAPPPLEALLGLGQPAPLLVEGLVGRSPRGRSRALDPYPGSRAVDCGVTLAG